MPLILILVSRHPIKKSNIQSPGGLSKNDMHTGANCPAFNQREHSKICNSCFEKKNTCFRHKNAQTKQFFAGQNSK